MSHIHSNIACNKRNDEQHSANKHATIDKLEGLKAYTVVEYTGAINVPAFAPWSTRSFLPAPTFCPV